MREVFLSTGAVGNLWIKRVSPISSQSRGLDAIHTQIFSSVLAAFSRFFGMTLSAMQNLPPISVGASVDKMFADRCNPYR